MPSPAGFAFLTGLLLVGGAALSGCKATGSLVENAPEAGQAAGYPNHTPVQIRALMEASTDDVRAYRSEARLDVEGRRSVNASAGLRARLTDTLYAVVRGPFGIEGGRGLVTADSFYAHDKINDRLYLGPIAAAERFVPGAGGRGVLSRALLGLEVPPLTAGWSVRAAGGRYVLTAPDGRQTWTVDPRYWRAVEVAETAADGRPLTRSFSAFDRVGGVVVPRRVVLASPGDGTTVTVEHRELTINPDALTFPFTPPRDAERVDVGRR